MWYFLKYTFHITLYYATSFFKSALFKDWGKKLPYVRVRETMITETNLQKTSNIGELLITPISSWLYYHTPLVLC